jgi:PEP-CTERM motif
VTDGFSTDSKGPFVSSGPFSITEQAIYTLPAHGELINRGQTEVLSIIPEPSTWVMMVIGFIGLGYAAIRRGKKDRSAAAI